MPVRSETKQIIAELVLLALFAIGTVWLAMTLYARWLVKTPAPSPSRIAPSRLIEAETLRTVARSPGLRLSVQSTAMWASPDTWSGDAHLFAESKRGDFVEFELPPLTGRHRITLFFSRGSDYGTLRLSLNGKTVGPDVDTGPTLAGQPEPVIAVEAGVFDLAGKDDILRIEVTEKGARSKAPFYQFGFDGLTAKPE